jgi:hypothetical protein
VPLSRPLLLWLTLATTALAKPWNGIAPGDSSAEDVTSRFGDPSKTLTAGGKETLVYSGREAIQGTVQAQFKLGPEHVVERIDVYPAVVLRVEAIERAYGPACDATKSNEPCFVRKETPQKHPYYVYSKLGLAVFFKDDGKTVQSLSFLPGT